MEPVILVLGIVAVVLTAWSWAGRGPGARWWTTGFDVDRVALGVLPGAGLLLLGLGLVGTGVAGVEMVGLLCWLVAFPVFVIGMIRPRWWGPRWYRQREQARRARRSRGRA